MNITIAERTQQPAAAKAEHLPIRTDAVRQGLRQGEFVLHYQPKVNMRSGEVIGVEALIRWVGGAEGLIPPSRFLPLIENTPVQFELDQWVVEHAMVQIEAWQAVGVQLPVSVNISAQSLQDCAFIERLDALQRKYPGVPLGLLELEVLESSALDDLALAANILHACRDRGLRISLDDFGTGYASLAYVKDLPADTLKLDQSFVRGILEDARSQAIVEHVVALANTFGLKMVAEGVETLAHGRHLLELGCEHAQGYGIARPMPADRVLAWLRGWRVDAVWMAVRESGCRTASRTGVARGPLVVSANGDRLTGSTRGRACCGQRLSSVGRPAINRSLREVGLGVRCKPISGMDQARPAHPRRASMRGRGGGLAGAQVEACRGLGLASSVRLSSARRTCGVS